MSAAGCGTGLSSCVWCGSTQKLQRCGQCHSVCYCCKEHQIQHWNIHRKNCTKILSMSDKTPPNLPNRCAPEQLRTGDYISDAQEPYIFLQDPKISSILQPMPNSEESATSPTVWCDTTTTACFRPPEGNLFHNLHATYGSFTNGLTRMSDTSSTLDDGLAFPNIGGPSTGADPFAQYAFQGMNDINIENLQYRTGLNDRQQTNGEGCSENRVENNLFLHEMGLSVQPGRQTDVVMQPDRGIPGFNTDRTNQWHQKICELIIKDMNRFGICVIDNFLGQQYGESVLQEVTAMYKSGGFQEGKLVSKRGQNASQAIRTDLITWVDGTEPNCAAVGFLIQTLDSIITKCNKMRNNGDLGRYRINTRTKAMIACYPGNNTHYVKHVDNPDQDGRCITSIYYLNKGWREELHGGLLRMYPAGLNQQVANIAPYFDRMLLFWSDRRNPHEVQPAKSIRFAITVWYFDADERNRALMRVQDQQNQQKHVQDKNMFPYSN